MAVVMPPGRPYVLPAALWPTYAAHANDAADLYAQAGTGCAQEADDSRATAARLGMLTEGLFSEAMRPHTSGSAWPTTTTRRFAAI